VKALRIIIAFVVLAVVTVLSVRTPLHVTRFWSGVPSDVSYDGKRVNASVLLGTIDSAFDRLLLDTHQYDGVVYVVNLTSHQVSQLQTLNYRNASSPPVDAALKPLVTTDVVVEPWHVEFTKPDGSHVRIRYMANA